jgi:ribosomal protein L18
MKNIIYNQQFQAPQKGTCHSDRASFRRWSSTWYVVLCLVAGLLPTSTVVSQQIKDTRKETRIYEYTPGITVQISNKYGTVQVQTWNQDSIKLEVTRTITHASQEEIDKLKNNITINYTSTQSLLNAETQFESTGNKWLQNIKEATNMANAESHSRIDYLLTVPAKTNINITNKYGDIILPSLNGRIMVNLSNGNFQAQTLNGWTDLTLAFGSAIIDHLNKGIIKTNFTNLSLTGSHNLLLESRSSDISIEEAGTLELNSRRDQLKIGKASIVKGTTYFSHFSCQQVIDKCNLNLTYGELSSLGINAGVTACVIIANTCNLNLQMNQPRAYTMLLKQTKGERNLPITLKETDNETAIQDIRKFYFKTKAGGTELKINIQDGNLKITHL